MANSTNRTLTAANIDGQKSIINYITNGDATTNTAGWATYADAAGTSPVDGTGGSPTVTWTRSTSSPLSLDASFLLTKDAANRQGQGASFDFSIATTDQAKVLQIEFDYIVSSGTFVAGSSSTDSDVTIWIYDVTNGVVIQPTTYKLYSNSSTTSDKFVSNFQTASNSTSYRLILHVGSTSASAYTLKVDRVRVSPSQYVYGTPITDWVSYTPTGSWSTNTTYTGRKRRVGDVGEYDIAISLSGAPTAATLTINMPSGETIDTTKISDTTSGLKHLGTGWILDSGTINYGLAQVSYFSSTAVLVRYTNASATGTGTNLLTVSNTAPMTFASGDKITLRYSAPIAGWSSSVQTSDQADSRVVAMLVRVSTCGGPLDNSAATQFSATPTIDTHGAYNGTSNYIVPVSGIYEVSGAVSVGGTEAVNDFVNLHVYKNSTLQQVGTVRVMSTGLTAVNPQVSCLVSCVAGDILTLRTYTSVASAAFTGDASQNWFQVKRLSQASLISATETVAFNVYGATTTIGTSATDVIFPSKAKDTHNAYSTSTGIFTVPVSGWYTFNWRGQSSSAVTASAADSGTTLTLTVNGTDIASGQTFVYQVTGVSLSPRITGSATIYCNAGDAVKITGARAAGVNSWSLTSAQNGTYFTGARIGI